MVEQPIRNRQVVGSTPTLGSNIFLILFTLVTSVHRTFHFRCMVVAYCEFFAQHIESIDL